ncbi:DUF3857 and transglutaminase domain-containing protein [Flavobacterium sp. '19STA2R22 D10 B1']|uniref:DUF3857 and transglutaminase domain-containing protein n=1 Tax=Flavobacterium aerium TaxID=3037261 RepID=UPI00278C2787|nr:DUF3857 and transglutaminase domain-containing protein [Flavobacterium sp. '19STA2R22 D10 B1']
MKKITLIFIITCCFIFNNLLAQKQELGKVTAEELLEKEHPREKDAPAAILYNKGNTYFEYSPQNGFVMVTDVQMKIKIYKKEGYEWANDAIKYYVYNNPKETVDYSKAYTYNLVNGKIEKTKLKSDGEFNNSINKYWSQKKITMPNVKEGSIIEYQYSIRSPYFSSFPEWKFQYNIPVDYSEYKTVVPEYYVYNIRTKGFITPVIKTENKTKKQSFTSREALEDKGVGYGGPLTEAVTRTLEFNEVNTTYVLKDVPALKEESYVNNIANYTASIQHELSLTRFPNASFKKYSTTWEEVAKTIYDNDDFGSELKKTGYFEKDIDALIASLSTKEEKITAIYDYVKKRMNWNDFSGYACNDGVKKAYTNKVGNSAEINLMLTAMLRYAGLVANPVILSTRDNGIALFPSRTAYNYVIAGVEINNTYMLLDATNKYGAPNILPIRDLNWSGRLIKTDGASIEVDLMPKNNSKEMTTMNYTISDKGEISGQVRTFHTDYNAFLFRARYVGVNKDNYLEKLEKDNNGIEIDNYAVDNELDLSKPIGESYLFKDNKFCELIGDKIYFSPLLFTMTSSNPFKQDKREYPVDFVYPTQNRYTIGVQIPEGYVVESIPAPISIQLGDKMATFKFNISNANNQINLVVNHDTNDVVIRADDYIALKDYYQKIIEKQTERIVLKKG